MLALGSACKRGAMTTHEYMYVSAPETSLRDRVATMYNKVGTVRNGDRVEILEKQKRFFRVRTSNGQEGWVEMRSLVTQDVFDVSLYEHKDRGAGKRRDSSLGRRIPLRQRRLVLRQHGCAEVQ